MSYSIMEAMLVEKVHKLRQSENRLLRSYLQLQLNPCDVTTSAITMRLNHVDSQVNAIEALMGEMDRVKEIASAYQV
jgi:hypothetical protein